MRKKLVKHGNSLALVIEKPILELLNIDADTELEVSTDGRSLAFRPASTFVEASRGTSPVELDDDFSAILKRQNTEYAAMFKNLAKGAK